jgi:hypothetical protein
MKTSAAMETASAMKAAPEARLPASRKPSRDASMIEATESAGVHATLAVGRRESMLWRPTVKASPMKAMIEPASASVEVITINENSAVGHVAVVVEKDAVMVPIGSPMVPTPAKTTKKANAEAEAKSNSGTRKVQTGIPVPAWPDRNRRAIDKPRIVLRHVDHLGVGRFDHDRRSVVGHLLL